MLADLFVADDFKSVFCFLFNYFCLKLDLPLMKVNATQPQNVLDVVELRLAAAPGKTVSESFRES